MKAIAKARTGWGFVLTEWCARQGSGFATSVFFFLCAVARQTELPGDMPWLLWCMGVQQFPGFPRELSQEKLATGNEN